MKFEVSKEAAQWYIDEMELKQGDYVQFYVKLYGGIPTVHPNYSLGVEVGKEGEVIIKDVVEGVTFYFNNQDAWFLEEYDMKIVVANGEADFIFTKS
ncbi:HesB/YadR/YfhF family protein [Fredinandcohnia quinoae]|uniref:Uncharacterized protein n=1 Tax=Fredinandcohnia quinoae TaxID=2918902 RepID=A0AAW5EC57_9BACI|nr:hypothetical protein [Fredinandcohnia sp. SECRCQ15]MCH1627041.1 hypothetical protein [Fredinandcohnia sp. SECRCQ15]